MNHWLNNVNIVQEKVNYTEVYKTEYILQGTWSSNPSASLTCNILFNFEYYFINSLEENNGDDRSLEDLN